MNPGWGPFVLSTNSPNTPGPTVCGGVEGQLPFPGLVVVEARLCFRLWCHPEGSGQLRGAKEVGVGSSRGAELVLC